MVSMAEAFKLRLEEWAAPISLVVRAAGATLGQWGTRRLLELDQVAEVLAPGT
jgi:hypothetical protein